FHQPPRLASAAVERRPGPTRAAVDVRLRLQPRPGLPSFGRRRRPRPPRPHRRRPPRPLRTGHRPAPPHLTRAAGHLASAAGRLTRLLSSRAVSAFNQSRDIQHSTNRDRSAAAEAMGRPKRGERRIDAAIDHLAEQGFPKPRIRKAINELQKVYGQNGWMFLEEASYDVVRNKLLDEQEQLEKQAAADEASPANDMEVSQEVHSEALSEPQSALEQASPNNSFPQELPPPPAARARPPCHGWISEESDTESEIEENEEVISGAPRPAISPIKDVPNPAGTLPSKRKQPTRWDVRPNGV
ncbi:unnamed protein product, partial [Urochloa humidicola]